MISARPRLENPVALKARGLGVGAGTPMGAVGSRVSHGVLGFDFEQKHLQFLYFLFCQKNRMVIQ